MDIISIDHTKIVATLVVRDEEDILEDMLSHTLSEGVTHIFATDNASRDNTRHILARHPEVVDIHYSDDMTHNQETHTTRMAIKACALKPDWIVHLDADEFWCGLGDIQSHSEHALWATTAFVHPPARNVTKNQAPLRHMQKYVDFRGHAREFKVIHRPSPTVMVKHGNHGVLGLGKMGYCDEITRHHYPIRSFNQFARKVQQGTEALKARQFVCERWYLWYEEWQAGNLGKLYEAMIGAWDAFGAGDMPPEALLRDVLASYRVIPQTIDNIFQGLRSGGEQAIIGTWLPSSYHRRPLL